MGASSRLGPDADNVALGISERGYKQRAFWTRRHGNLAAVLDDCLERLVDPFNVDVGTNTALPGIDLTGYEVTDHVPHFRP